MRLRTQLDCYRKKGCSLRRRVHVLAVKNELDGIERSLHCREKRHRQRPSTISRENMSERKPYTVSDRGGPSANVRPPPDTGAATQEPNHSHSSRPQKPPNASGRLEDRRPRRNSHLPSWTAGPGRYAVVSILYRALHAERPLPPPMVMSIPRCGRSFTGINPPACQLQRLAEHLEKGRNGRRDDLDDYIDRGVRRQWRRGR